MRVYNTLTGQKEEFKPDGDVVKMYVCGVTPYADTHIGHAMAYLTFDMIRRYLEYRGYRVKHVQNFTDIDDKIIDRAIRLGVSARDLAERYIADYLENMDALNIKRADVYPRATEEIGPIVDMVKGLIAGGHAYVVDGDVYFRVKSWPRYGAVSGRSLESMVAGSRIEVDPRKDDPLDFALWKAAKPGEPSWDSPWGPGRPGWHIECSAMSLKYLGEKIDIHGGGQDLVFPHHENELAQSEAYTGKFPFVKYWMHNGLLQLGGEKMSKSFGNLVTVKEALSEHSADALRLFVLSSYYRSPITYSEDVVEAAERGVERIRMALAAAQGPGAREQGPEVGETGPEASAAEALKAAAERARNGFIQAMDDDFGTPAAIAALFDLVKEINRYREQGVGQEALADAQATLRELSEVLGFTLAKPVAAEELAAKPFIDLLVSVRQDLRKAKQWALADRIRGELADMGVVLEDRPEGTIWRRT